MIKVLVADDEVNIADSIEYALKREGFITEIAYDGLEALDKIKKFKPNIIILDIMMPYKDGYEICREINKDLNTWIIMLTAKSQVYDKVVGFEIGADDYMTKPFEMMELMARIKSVAKRMEMLIKKYDESKLSNIQIGDLKIIYDERKVMLYEDEIEFKNKEFELLYLLFSNIGKVFTREDIINKVWGYEYYGGTRTVDTHIRRIREKLGDFSNLIRTISRVGYKAVELENEN
ncbi:MAG: response regulator transcription factor [Peptostreptococcaceae bacterium]|jgi:DNA-binding response OmpR family regulator|nr:response regulator transcription factor [Peptostreptococcaceae bacterium]